MSDEPKTNAPRPADPGKWIRFALVALPAGTIVLGALSFVIYFEKKEREKEIAYGHALALRRDIDAADIGRHIAVLQDAARLPAEEGRKTAASYLESTLSPENMGYETRRDEWQANGQERANIRVRLPGTKRPQDAVLVLAGYGGKMDASQIASLAAWLSLAHAMTGDPKIKAVEFAALDVSDGGRAAADRLLAELHERQARAVHVHWLAPAGQQAGGEIAGRFAGARTASHALAGSPMELKAQADAVLRLILDAADHL